MFSLLNELEEIKEIRTLTESIKLCEDIGKFLQPIIVKINDAVENDKNPFSGQNPLNKEELASIITGLNSLSDSDERAAHDVLGDDSKFYIFLSALGEKGNPNTDKAEKHLKNFFKNHASYKTLYTNNLKKLELLEKPSKDENVKKEKQKIVDELKKISYNLQMQMNKLKTTLAAKKAETAQKTA
jgi:hypothetical protein